ncbi:hypothetical protein [Pseudomonas putida]|uniref:hypothetical protein n=1 Tax=Pseudomonas putida TaxID=303 RepID=UPI0018D86639|nr:hypothetical protein [Pseudomonas putida]MBH3472183.1 hypothetical protein [Pseudomonas putida]
MKANNPKLKTKHAKSIFKYYAGFSDDFALDIIEKELAFYSGEEPFVVLDPWNGSGTTTNACNMLGVNSVGIDRNPTMAILAVAREACIDSIESALNIIPRQSSVKKDDPLLTWFMPSSARHLRELEAGIQEIKIQEGRALGYVLLFNATKNLLKRYQTTNPTWIKKPDKKNRIRPTRDQVQLELSRVQDSFALQNSPIPNKKIKSVITTADSRKLPIANNSINLTVTSPPYCTRIDYAVATSIELSILSYDQKQFNQLREALIGSTTVINGITSNPKWGNTCCRTLDRIKNHPSKASSGYYTKNFLRYFDALFESICEINRVTKIQGTCHMVIQDSYYKEIHIDLPLIASEMFLNIGWILEGRQDFISTRNKATINSKSSKYQQKKIATESVITLRKKT